MWPFHANAQGESAFGLAGLHGGLKEPVCEGLAEACEQGADRLAPDSAQVLSSHRRENLAVEDDMHGARGPEDWIAKCIGQVKVVNARDELVLAVARIAESDAVIFTGCSVGNLEVVAGEGWS
jgi:hypothetical protein